MSIIARSISAIGLTQGVRPISAVGYLANNTSGRSGVNRLLLAQLQEESLRQDEERKKAEQEKEVGPIKKAGPVKRPTPKKERVIEAPQEAIPPFRPLPSFEPQPLLPNYVIDAMRITLQIRQMVTMYQPIAVILHQQTTTKIVVANDEEDVELLLLAF